MTVGENGSILVVDDEPQICRVLHTILIEQGFEVLLVRRGDKALEFIRSEHFDLILLDLNLPDIPGIELCSAIRSACDTVIIVLTVRSDVGDKVALLDAGADDYVTKPFDTAVLLARIQLIYDATDRRTGWTPSLPMTGQLILGREPSLDSRRKSGCHENSTSCFAIS